MRLDRAIQSAIVGEKLAPTVTKFRKASTQMEQVFLKQLFAQMRQVGSFSTEKSHGMQMYQDMMDDAMAEAVAKRGDFGIAKQLRQTMEPAMFRQEVANLKLRCRANGDGNELIKADVPAESKTDIAI